jgi:hypothetical protein
MKQGKRKCLCCAQFFQPDPRNRRHQRYCSKPACRSASHAASQAHWVSKPENRDYFRGPIHVARVQAWRQAHPGYSNRARGRVGAALQEDCRAQAIEVSSHSADLALQEISRAQPLVLLGLIAHVTHCALQEDIAAALRRLIELAQDVLGARAVCRPGAKSRGCATGRG